MLVIRFLQMFAKFCCKSTEIAVFSMKFSRIFAGISEYCRQLPEVTIVCTIFSKFARQFCNILQKKLAKNIATPAGWPRWGVRSHIGSGARRGSRGRRRSCSGAPARCRPLPGQHVEPRAHVVHWTLLPALCFHDVHWFCPFQDIR